MNLTAKSIDFGELAAYSMSANVGSDYGSTTGDQ